MSEKPKVGSLIALGVGTGLIAYSTKIRGNPKFAGPSSETWLDAALVVVPFMAGLALVVYLILKGWDALMARLRRRRAGSR